MYLGDDTYDDATDAELRPEWRTPAEQRRVMSASDADRRFAIGEVEVLERVGGRVQVRRG